MMAMVCWWISGSLLVAAFITTSVGIGWKAPDVLNDNGDGTRTTAPFERVQQVRVRFLQIGLLLTTLAGIAALLSAPPWG